MNKFISICLASVLSVTTLVGGGSAILAKDTAVQITNPQVSTQEDKADAKFVTTQNTVQNEQNKQNLNINNSDANNQNNCINGNCTNGVASTYNEVYNNMNNTSTAGYNNAYNANTQY